MKVPLRIGIAITLLLVGISSFAQRHPSSPSSPPKRPNIAAAQRQSSEAYEKIVAAQKANEWDASGHAQRAKELLEQVHAELKLASEAAGPNTK